jgi:hypothetical protein
MRTTNMRRMAWLILTILSLVAFVLLVWDNFVTRHEGIHETWLSTPYNCDVGVEAQRWNRSIQFNYAHVEVSPIAAATQPATRPPSQMSWSLDRKFGRTWGWGPRKEDTFLGFGVGSDAFKFPEMGYAVHIESLRMPVWWALGVTLALPVIRALRWWRMRSRLRDGRGFEVENSSLRAPQ